MERDRCRLTASYVSDGYDSYDKCTTLSFVQYRMKNTTTVACLLRCLISNQFHSHASTVHFLYSADSETLCRC